MSDMSDAQVYTPVLGGVVIPSSWGPAKVQAMPGSAFATPMGEKIEAIEAELSRIKENSTHIAVAKDQENRICELESVVGELMEFVKEQKSMLEEAEKLRRLEAEKLERLNSEQQRMINTVTIGSNGYSGNFAPVQYGSNLALNPHPQSSAAANQQAVFTQSLAKAAESKAFSLAKALGLK